MIACPLTRDIAWWTCSLLSHSHRRIPSRDEPGGGRDQGISVGQAHAGPVPEAAQAGHVLALRLAQLQQEGPLRLKVDSRPSDSVAPVTPRQVGRVAWDQTKCKTCVARDRYSLWNKPTYGANGRKGREKKTWLKITVCRMGNPPNKRDN